GAVRIYVNSDDFKVIDNKMGNVRLQTAIEIGGELRAPRVEGYVGVTTGRIALDQILASVGPSPYAPEQTAYVSEPAPPAQQAPPTGLAARKMDVHRTGPNDRRVKENNLTTP